MMQIPQTPGIRKKKKKAKAEKHLFLIALLHNILLSTITRVILLTIVALDGRKFRSQQTQALYINHY